MILHCVFLKIVATIFWVLVIFNRNEICCYSYIFHGTRKKSPGRGQNLERRNVERPIFWNFKIANIKITKVNSIILFSNLIFYFLEIIWTPEIFNDFSSCEILIFQMVKLNFFIFHIVKFHKTVNQSKLVNYYIIS